METENMNVGSWYLQMAAPFSGEARLSEAFGRVEDKTKNGVCKSRLEAGTKHGPSRCYAQK